MRIFILALSAVLFATSGSLNAQESMGMAGFDPIPLTPAVEGFSAQIQSDLAEKPAVDLQAEQRQEEAERRGKKGKRQKGGKKGRDGKVDGKKRLEKLLERFDSNSDGVISSDEIPAKMKGKFSKLDTNGDGRFDKAEQQQMVERTKKQRGDGKNRGAKGKKQPGAKGKPGDRKKPDGNQQGGKKRDAKRKKRGDRGAGGAQGILMNADANGDGDVSMDEALEQMRTLFARVDKNGNGLIEADELKAVQARRGKAKGEGKGKKRDKKLRQGKKDKANKPSLDGVQPVRPKK